MKLYDYYRSTTCYRVRIALYYKGIPFESIPTHLIKDGGQQHSPDYVAINPQALVPTLDLEENGKVITQSLAIIEYLDETYPTPTLLPGSPYEKAQIRQLASIVACDMHPLNNLRVKQALEQDFKASESQIIQWYHMWLKKGFDAVEGWLEHLPRSEPVCLGNTISLADVCLVPQVYNAKRFNFPLEHYPLITDISNYCESLPYFQMAAPERTAEDYA